MNVNIVLAGLRKDSAESVLQRMEAVTAGLPADARIAVYQYESEEAEEEVCGWAGRLTCQDTDMPADVTIFSGTPEGKELAMAFAARKNLPCHTEVVSLNETNGNLRAVRNVYSTHLNASLPACGAVLAVSAAGEKKEYEPVRRENVTIRPFELLAGELINMNWKKDTLLSETALEKGEDLASAKLVLLGGKGLGKKENFERLEVLAEKLGASCGCTRPVAMAGWTGYDKVVGISGSILNADVCIAFGVSGAGPLMAGAGGAARLIAVNNDPKAPIFKAAHEGLVADCLEILTAMEQEVQ